MEPSGKENYLLLSAQNALIGEVTPELRAVSLDVDKETNCLIVYFFYDCSITDQLLDRANCITLEIDTSDSPDRITFTDTQVLEWRYPKPIPKKGVWVYQRKEEGL